MGWLTDLFGGGVQKEAKRAKKEAERAEQERQSNIARGREDINRIFGETFSPEFFAGISQNYSDWAMPQLERQNETATQNLLYALARAGTSRSSTAAKGKADLQEQFDLGRQTVAQRGEDLANRRRIDVENQRQAIEAQLYATEDPAAAAAAAANSTFNSSFRPEYEPMAQLITDVSSWYGIPMSSHPGFVQQAAGYGGGGTGSGYRVGG